MVPVTGVEPVCRVVCLCYNNSPLIFQRAGFGAGDRGRTGTDFTPLDFEAEGALIIVYY